MALFEYGLRFQEQLGFSCKAQASKNDSPSPVYLQGVDAVGSAFHIPPNHSLADINVQLEITEKEGKTKGREETRNGNHRDHKSEHHKVVEISNNDLGDLPQHHKSRKAWDGTDSKKDWNNDPGNTGILFDKGLRGDEVRRELIREQQMARRKAAAEKRGESTQWNEDFTKPTQGGVFGPAPSLPKRSKKRLTQRHQKHKKKVKPYTLDPQDSKRRLWEPKRKVEAPKPFLHRHSPRPHPQQPSRKQVEQEETLHELVLSDDEVQRESSVEQGRYMLHSPAIEIEQPISVRPKQTQPGKPNVQVAFPDSPPTPGVNPVEYAQSLFGEAFQRHSTSLLQQVEALLDQRLSKKDSKKGSTTTRGMGTNTTTTRPTLVDVRRGKSSAGEQHVSELSLLQTKQAEETLARLGRLVELETSMAQKWAHLKSRKTSSNSRTMSKNNLQDDGHQRESLESSLGLAKPEKVLFPRREENDKLVTISAVTEKSIRDNVLRFKRHREYMEATLRGTGMNQAQIVESLADLVFESICQEVSTELLESCDDVANVLIETV